MRLEELLSYTLIRPEDQIYRFRFSVSLKALHYRTEGKPCVSPLEGAPRLIVASFLLFGLALCV